MEIRFTVKGLPPLKNGGKSVWATNKVGVDHLREVANNAINEANIKGPLTGFFLFDIKIFMPKDKLLVADIDNFVGGIFDALQEPPQGFKSNFPNIINDDANVVSVSAAKIPLMSDSDEPYYVVTIKTEANWLWLNIDKLTKIITIHRSDSPSGRCQPQKKIKRNGGWILITDSFELNRIIGEYPGYNIKYCSDCSK